MRNIGQSLKQFFDWLYLTIKIRGVRMLNLLSVKKLAEEKAAVDVFSNSVAIALNSQLEAINKETLKGFVGLPRFEFSRVHGMSGLKSAILTKEYADMHPNAVAVKISDHQYYNEVLSHFILEEKSKILAKGIYIAFVDNAEASAALSVLLNIPASLLDPGAISCLNFEKIVFVKLELEALAV